MAVRYRLVINTYTEIIKTLIIAHLSASQAMYYFAGTKALQVWSTVCTVTQFLPDNLCFEEWSVIKCVHPGHVAFPSLATDEH